MVPTFGGVEPSPLAELHRPLRPGRQGVGPCHPHMDHGGQAGVCVLRVMAHRDDRRGDRVRVVHVDRSVHRVPVLIRVRDVPADGVIPERDDVPQPQRDHRRREDRQRRLRKVPAARRVRQKAVIHAPIGQPRLPTEVVNPRVAVEHVKATSVAQLQPAPIDVIWQGVAVSVNTSDACPTPLLEFQRHAEAVHREPRPVDRGRQQPRYNGIEVQQVH
mmetsp:Transcript_114123/g.329656  ORF Transcript_114123/g.329656 Transcript_114123/m.329656 type:complete len:217 (-) Transcript_114123:705-1355(-)